MAMSAGTTRAGAPAAASGAGADPWLIAVLVAVAVFMEVLDTTIADVALRYIAGGLGVSEDEASWVVTTYFVANAMIVMATSFVSRWFGRKAVFLTCLGLFTLSSVLSGMAGDLKSLLLFRILQGFAGGGMVPVAQSILTDSFPPAKRGEAFALFGVAVVVAPVVGPTLGGWLSDNYSWHWCFLINGPVGLLEMALIALILREPPAAVEERTRLKQQGLRFDLVGFVLVAAFLGALEIVLDRGVIDDWFGSNFIIAFAVISGLAFLLMIPWEATRRNPAADVRMVATRQFGACFLVMRHPVLDDPIPSPAGGGGFWLYGHLGWPRARAWRPGHHGDDVRRRPPVGQGSAQIFDRHRGGDRRAVNVRLDQCLRRSRLLVFRHLAHAPRLWVSVDLRPDHDRVPRRHSAGQDGPGLGFDQCGAQYRGLHRHLSCLQRAGASRAVPSKPACRGCDPVERAISGHATPGDGLFRRPGQLASPSAAAGLRLDWPASAGAGVAARLYGRFLGSDACLACGSSARACPAKGQAGGRRAHGPLRPI
jgi:MFS family permease